MSSLINRESDRTTSVAGQLLRSLRDRDYRHLFVPERVRSSVALQIRVLREQRGMTQKQLGDAIGMAQTWVSKLENPDYGKMTVATLLRLAEAFDTDLEIKFRPFSRLLDTVPTSGPEYYAVPSFTEEFGDYVLDSEVSAMTEFLNELDPSTDLTFMPKGARFEPLQQQVNRLEQRFDSLQSAVSQNGQLAGIRSTLEDTKSTVEKISVHLDHHRIGLKVLFTLAGIFILALGKGISDLSEIKTMLTRRTVAIADTIKDAISSPSTAAATTAVERGLIAIRTASVQGLKVDQKLVAEYGRKAVDIVKQDSSAPDSVWAAALEALSVNTSVASVSIGMPNLSRHNPHTVYFTVEPPPGWKQPEVKWLGGDLPLDRSAAVVPLGTHPKGQSNLGPQWLELRSGGVKMDGYLFRRVLFSNVHISYSGGPTRMEEVRFKDCTFAFNRAGNSLQLADMLFQRPTGPVSIGTHAAALRLVYRWTETDSLSTASRY